MVLFLPPPPEKSFFSNTTMDQRVKINIQVERNGPPPPQRAKTPPSVLYPFNDIPLGCSARFPRATITVKHRLADFYKTPESKGKQFVIRPITKAMCRVWRVK